MAILQPHDTRTRGIVCWNFLANLVRGRHATDPTSLPIGSSGDEVWVSIPCH